MVQEGAKKFQGRHEPPAPTSRAYVLINTLIRFEIVKNITNESTINR